MAAGRITGESSRAEADQELLMRYMTHDPAVPAPRHPAPHEGLIDEH